jgi:glycosyltransferase involved in cell wall biosynthesis
LQEKLMTEPPLRIGFLTNEYPTQGFTGGIGSYVRQMAQSLAGLGHSPCVLLWVPSDGGLVWDGPVPIYRIVVAGLASRMPWPLGTGASLVFARTLGRLANELNLDVLEAPEWGGLTAFLSLVKPRKLRVVVRLHTCSAIIRQVNKWRPESIRDRLNCYRNDIAEKRAIVTADKVTAVSKAIGEETRKALRLSNGGFEVIPNSVDDSAFCASEDSETAGRPIVLFVGRLEWRKGPDLLIRAIPAILERHPEVKFRFAGMDTLTGPQNSSMKSYLEALLLPEARASVDFSGHLGPSQLDEALRQATVCVFPSRYEGLPMVCLEAMARGKAIVTTDLPGFCELISDGETGMIAEHENSESLASALEKLISDAMLRVRLGSAARKVARSHFHGAVVAKSMLQVYRTAIAAAESNGRNGSN